MQILKRKFLETMRYIKLCHKTQRNKFWKLFLFEHQKFQFLLNLQSKTIKQAFFSHSRIWKILGCDRLPSLKGISSSRFEKARKVSDLGNLGATTPKRNFGFASCRFMWPWIRCLASKSYSFLNLERAYSKNMNLNSIHASP
jgi:hypothetical protein